MLFAHESIEITHGKTTFKGTLTNAIDKQHPGLLWRAPWTAATHMRGLAPDLPPAPSRKHLHKCVNGYACPIGSPKLCSFLIRPDPQWRHQSDFASLASDGDTRSAWQCPCEFASIGIEIAQEIAEIGKTSCRERGGQDA